MALVGVVGAIGVEAAMVGGEGAVWVEAALVGGGGEKLLLIPYPLRLSLDEVRLQLGLGN